MRRPIPFSYNFLQKRKINSINVFLKTGDFVVKKQANCKSILLFHVKIEFIKSKKRQHIYFIEGKYYRLQTLQ